MRSVVQAVLTVSLLSLAVGSLLLAGCDTWHGLGKDVSKTGDAMSGEGKYTMTVNATPDTVTAAARKAVEQLKMTDIKSSGNRSEGKVTAKTARQDSVKIEVEQLGHKDSKVTIFTHGGDADDVSKQLQDRIRGNLP
jgi:predicted small secreted protein